MERSGRGRPVDKRTDVWAFGCVLYESLTGKRAFEGGTVAETLAAILKGEADWQALPAATPWRVKDLLHRCLQKDPKERLHDIADVRIEITEALGQPVPVVANVMQPINSTHAAYNTCAGQFSISSSGWLTYVSDESGRLEVYVRSFPNPGGKWKLSLEGGTEPLWARNGKQLFYRWQDQVWAVDIRTDTGFTPSKSRLLFEKPGDRMSSPTRCWDISLDGQPFLMVRLDERKPQSVTEMILVQNWFEELNCLAPAEKK